MPAKDLSMPDHVVTGLVNLAFGLPSGSEWIILLVLGLLIFGRRLPEVGRSIGRSVVEFKKGIKGIEEEIEQESSRPAAAPPARLSEQPAPGIPATRSSLPSEQSHV
jgi:sec-independent protein translocase protein TatA